MSNQERHEVPKQSLPDVNNSSGFGMKITDYAILERIIFSSTLGLLPTEIFDELDQKYDPKSGQVALQQKTNAIIGMGTVLRLYDIHSGGKLKDAFSQFVREHTKDVQREIRSLLANNMQDRELSWIPRTNKFIIDIGRQISISPIFISSEVEVDQATMQQLTIPFNQGAILMTHMLNTFWPQFSGERS